MRLEETVSSSSTRSCCTHMSVQVVKANSNGREEGLAIGDRWVHLRRCLSSGHVGCCDQSQDQYACKYFEAGGHPIIRSLEPREDWAWSYVDGIITR